MKILFIYRNEFVEPLGIMTLSSFLKQHGRDCYFIDIKFEKNFIKELEKISPDIIAYSVTTGKHKFYQKLNQELKKKFKFFALFGGPHCTFFPEFIYKEGVDAICRGEGEFAFLELVDGLEKGNDITKIKNLWVKINSEVYKNEVRDLIEDLDALPFPDRELINKYNHYRKTWIRFALSGRGCPYRCTYCFNSSYNKIYQGKGRIIRKRSVGNVIKELKFIKDTYWPKRFHFMDDTFNLDYKWLLEFCDAYKKEINIPLLAIIRLNLVNEGIVRALKDAVCITAVSSIESGNEYMRNVILKRGISEKQIIDANRLLRKYGIRRVMQNIVGLPDETLDMAFETLALNIKCKPTYSLVSIFQPYPMTELSEYSKQRGYFSGDVNLFDESLHNISVMKIKDIEKMERLHHLFSLTVAFPILLPLTKILIRLPLSRIYLFFWKLHRSYSYFFRLKFIDLPQLFIREKSLVSKADTY